MDRMSRFVVVYHGLADPPLAEQRSLTSALKKAVTVVDRMPGTILVDGVEAEVAGIVGGRPNWTFSPESSASIKPPHRRIKQAA
jgi:hypothetical protein